MLIFILNASKCIKYVNKIKKELESKKLKTITITFRIIF